MFNKVGFPDDSWTEKAKIVATRMRRILFSISGLLLTNEISFHKIITKTKTSKQTTTITITATTSTEKTTYITSLLRIILMATSWLAFMESRARTTLLKTP